MIGRALASAHQGVRAMHKLQFAGKNCVLDAYLYPPAGGKGLVRVTHVDARDRAGRDVDQARCVADIETR